MSADRSKPFAYRGDIDGLRAIAVLAVVIFHLGIDALEGGFIGVDIFFVISGFLITGIIAPKITSGQFALGSFYKRRVIRLLPPSLALIIVTFVAALFILDPVDLIAFAKSAIASTLSVSNIWFFSQAGYWDTASELKPLLHTWSLGVEEQFYLLWPAFIIALAKLPAKIKMGAVITVVMVLGTLLSEYMVRVNPSAAFYLLPARVFQFAFGATCLFMSRSAALRAALSSVATRDFVTLIGLIGLVATILMFEGTTPFPGFYGLVPCVFTGLLLIAGSVRTEGERASVKSVLLENPVSLWLGRMSYSMYLVHWPVVAFLRYEYGQRLSMPHMIFAAVLTLLLTLVLFHGVERRFSARAGMKAGVSVMASGKGAGGYKGATLQRFALPRIPAIIVAGLAIVIIASLAIHQNGWSWRSDRIVYTAEMVDAGIKARFEPFRDGTMCQVEDLGLDKCAAARKATILVMGNSHALDGVNILRGMDAANTDRRFLVIDTSMCAYRWAGGAGAPVSDKPICQTRMDAFIASGQINALTSVLYSANKPYNALKSGDVTLLRWLRARRPDLMTVTVEGFVNLKTECYRLINESGLNACLDLQNMSYFPSTADEGPFVADIQALSDYVVSKVGLLCTDPSAPSTCLNVAENGEPIMWDGNHLSQGYAMTIGRRLRSERPDLAAALLGPVSY